MENIDKNEEEVLTTSQEPAAEVKTNEDNGLKDNFKFTYPFTKLTTITDDYSGYLVLPGIDKDELGTYMESFNKAVANNEYNGVNEPLFKTSVAKVFNHRGLSLTNPNNEYSELLKENTFANEIIYGDNNLGIRKVGISPTANVNNNVALFMNKVRNSTGLGNTIQIPLYNSGLWLTVNPPKNQELIYIQNKLAEDAVLIGRETSKILGGTENFILTRSVTDFILDNLVVNTTLKLPAGEDIRDYIKGVDVQTLALAVVSTMYPDGFTITRSCRNSFIILEDGSRQCSHSINGLINPKHMHFKNSKKIDREMLIHMSKRMPNSVTPAEVREYQARNSVIQDVTKQVVTDTGIINITLSTPNLTHYNTTCNLWYDEMISQLDRLLEKADDLESKNEKAFNLMRTNYLSYFLPYVKSISKVDTDGNIEFDSAEMEEDKRPLANMEILNLVSVDGLILKEIEDIVKSYTKVNSLSIVAGPDYICPTCKAKQSDMSDNQHDFSNLIPIDVMMVFFTLSAIRTRMA